MYVILGATGNTGTVVANKLLSNNKKVRVVGRDAGRLSRFTQKGAEAAVADATDAAALAKAFSGATAVYAMIPPKLDAADVRAYQTQVTDATVSAIKQANVNSVVLLSSVGADKADGTGPVAGLHDMEEELSSIVGLNAVFLRAGYFMENLLAQTAAIKNMGTMAGPVRADLPLPMIATRDIGAAAADLLLSLDFKSVRTQELLGPRDVTYNEVAKVISAAMHGPALGYQQVPGGMLKPILQQLGMSANMADLLLEMSDALNSGHMRPLEPRSAKNFTPTTIETFVADQFVPAFTGKAISA